jgi:hypothetical protein
MFLLMHRFKPESLKEYPHERDAALYRHQTNAYHQAWRMRAVQSVAQTDERKPGTVAGHHRTIWPQGKRKIQ